MYLYLKLSHDPDPRTLLQYKKVYYKVGTSGRTILNVLAASISPTCFQEIMNNVCPRLIRAHVSKKGRNLGDDPLL